MLLLWATTTAQEAAPGAQQAPVQGKTAPQQVELDGISSRGQALADYDRALWGAVDAVLDLSPQPDTDWMYFVRKTGESWAGVLGKLSPAKDSFLVGFETLQPSASAEVRATRLDPPREEKAWFFHAALATGKAVADWGPHDRPYSVAVLPSEAAGLWVYLYPVRRRANAFPLGGDVRYRVSEDGTTILEKRRMHISVLESPGSSGSNGETKFYVHTAILGEVPEDTDVFAVVSREQRAPEIVVCPTWIFEISVAGKINCVGKTEDLKNASKGK